MNLRQFATLAAFLEQRSFASTGDRVGLSHSAVSIQMYRLEEELGAALFDRSSRPPSLTREGLAVAELARGVLDLTERMRRVARGRDIAARIGIGFVPTALALILPGILRQLRDAYPDVQIGIKSALSGELAAAVVRRELDFALITSPVVQMPEIKVLEIGREPLFAVGPRSLGHLVSDAELVTALPFISFNKRAWLGQQIAAQLQARGLHPREGMEVDSLDTIEALVAEGFGVSVLPQRLLAPPLSERLTRIPFGDPVSSRRLSLIEHVNNRQTELEAAVRRIFRSLAA